MKINKKRIKKRKLIDFNLINMIRGLSDRLSQREKILLASLVLLIAAGGYYLLVMSPNLARIDKLKGKLEETTIQYETMKKDIASDNPIFSEYKHTYAKAFFLSENMLTNFEQERIILLLDEILKASQLSYTNISFIQPEIVSVKEKKAPKEEKRTLLDEIVKRYGSLGNQTEEEQSVDSNVEEQEADHDSSEIKKMEIMIQYKSRYEHVLEFLREIESHSKKMVVSKLDMAVEEESNKIMGNIVINLFYAPILSEQSQQEEEWIYHNIYGKDNPFHYSVYSKGEKSSQKKEATDFIMTVKPITADLPTVMILKANDKDMSTHVYADNEGIEPVEFQLLQEGDQYFYKYKTSEESYPEEYNAEKIQFVPEGSTIDISIVSSDRNGKEDTSGMDLKLINKTDLECCVKVKYDDGDTKRVTIHQPFGKVTIVE